MIPYFILLSVPALTATLLYVAKIHEKKRFQITIDTFFFIWLILLFLRSELVGIDLLTYKYHFFNYPLMSWADIIKGIFEGEFEPGFVIITKVISYFTS